MAERWPTGHLGLVRECFFREGLTYSWSCGVFRSENNGLTLLSRSGITISPHPAASANPVTPTMSFYRFTTWLFLAYQLDCVECGCVWQVRWRQPPEERKTCIDHGQPFATSSLLGQWGFSIAVKHTILLFTLRRKKMAFPPSDWVWHALQNWLSPFSSSFVVTVIYSLQLHKCLTADMAVMQAIC